MKRLIILPFLALALACDSAQGPSAPEDVVAAAANGAKKNVLAMATGGFTVDHTPCTYPNPGTSCAISGFDVFRLTEVNALAKADGSFHGWIKGTVYNGYGNPYREIPVFCMKTFEGGQGSPHACPVGATCAEVWGILPPGQSTFPAQWESYAILLEDYGEGADAMTDEASRIEIESRTGSQATAMSETTAWCQNDDFFIPPTGGASVEDTDPIGEGNVQVKVK